MNAARPPLALLHGWAMTPAVWDGLRAALPGTTVLAPPLPGHGAAAPAPAGLAAWADALAAAIPDGAALGGWSLGALLALEIARRHPRKAARLLLIGATPRFVAAPDWPQGLAPDTVAAFTAGFATAPAATLKRFLALQCLGDAQRKTVQARLAATLAAPAGDELAAPEAGKELAAPQTGKELAAPETGKELAAPETGSGLADGLALLAGADLRDGLAALAQPCCLIHGAHDALMPAAAAQWLAGALPHARLHLLADAGHAVFLSRPAACAALIEAFLDD